MNLLIAPYIIISDIVLFILVVLLIVFIVRAVKKKKNEQPFSYKQTGDQDKLNKEDNETTLEEGKIMTDSEEEKTETTTDDEKIEMEFEEEKKDTEIIDFLLQDINLNDYKTPVYNFIEQTIMCIRNYFYFIPCIWFPDNGDLYTKTILKRDGFALTKEEILKKYSYTMNTRLKNYLHSTYEKTEILTDGLKDKLNELPFNISNKQAAAYAIIRNNIIKYFHDKYSTAVGYNDLRLFCENIPQKNNDYYVALFTYFYIYENDINLPLIETYNKISSQINDQYEIIRKEKIANSLFNEETKSNNTFNKQHSESRLSIEQIDKMTGRDFEIFIFNLFSKKGYKCELTPTTGDYGIDVIVYDTLGTKMGIQTKCYKDKVTNAAIQEVYAGLKHYSCDKAMIITNSYFTPAAIQAAQDNNVILWNRDKLIKEIEKP